MNKDKLLQKALKVLKKREQYILYNRKLIDNPKTQKQLSLEFKITAQRVSQIESLAFDKFQRAILRIFNNFTFLR